MTSENFTWNKGRILAAQLLAEDDLDDDVIAERVGVTPRTLYNWKTHADFTKRINDLTQAMQERMLRRGIARRERRIAAKHDRWERMRQVIEERAAAYKDRAAGGGSGLLVKQLKGVGHGEDFTIVEEFAVDTGLLREMREIEKQAAQEIGQWTEKTDLTSGGEPIKAYIGIDVDAV